MQQYANQYYTPEEYFALEETAEYKSEYYEGQIFAMSGGTPKHNVIAQNVGIEIGLAVRGKPYTTFSSAQRIMVKPNGFYTYPDVSVVCGPIELAPGRKDTITNPIVLVEVLSPSTENYDLGKKSTLYRSMPTFQSFLLVDQAQVLVEHFRRIDQNSWLIETFTDLTQTIQIPALEIEISLAFIYNNISFEK